MANLQSADQLLHTPGRLALTIAALGIVFGDIGTSPLYALQTVFSIDHAAVAPTRGDVFGVISMVFWSITLVVSVKYVLFVLRADHDGEGGVLALATLVRRQFRSTARRGAAAAMLGVVGAALFYGDSVITPAISVLSAVEGIKVAAPDLPDVVVPVALAILTGLFAGQRFGTHVVGRFFGPVMLAWFLTLAALGVPWILREPSIVAALSPSMALAFVADNPGLAFIAMGAVVLSITGAEALYADIGHFGAPPIRRAWFFLVFPCLVLNYLGQGALVLRNPGAVANPFFELGPSWSNYALVALATLATVIASQSVISGAYSVARQGMRLGYLPRFKVLNTSPHEQGQVYVPTVNWLLFVCVVVLVLGFRSSAGLATAYGVAVTATFLLTTVLLLVYARRAWHWNWPQVTLAALVFGSLELGYFAANLSKITHGGWLPLTIAAAVIAVMTTWQDGQTVVSAIRTTHEGPLSDYLASTELRKAKRVPGTVIYPHGHPTTAPLALRMNTKLNHVLHDRVIIVRMEDVPVPHVPLHEQLTVDGVTPAVAGVTHLTVRHGFQDARDLPAALATWRAVASHDRGGIDLNNVTYLLSRIRIHRFGDSDIHRLRKLLFVALSRTASSPVQQFYLPPKQTVVIAARVDL